MTIVASYGRPIVVNRAKLGELKLLGIEARRLIDRLRLQAALDDDGGRLSSFGQFSDRVVRLSR